ncbi:hypothetical protein UY3_08497 [Chelonia mydas]|uniref:Uncharacterized protein n=1 Tax=Chelonia mydas TaxID=8469 RepID=M7BQI8_CHEMY|nr:hypothetical protein UY3_08497 [Chelonia mydas]
MPILTALVSCLNAPAQQPGATPKTCQFYKELEAILGGNPTSTSPVVTLAGLEVSERGPNLEDEVTDDEVEFDNHVELPADSPGGASTVHPLEVSSQSQQLHSSEQEAGEETPDMALKDTAHTPAKRLHQIRKRPRWSKDNVFQEILHFSTAEKKEHKEWKEAERLDRREKSGVC